MKKIPLFILAVILYCAGCENHPTATIVFCQDLSPDNNCIGENQRFPLSEVFVRCEIEGTVKTGTIVGNLYGLNGDQRIPYGNRVFELAPDERVITQSIPFHEFGAEGIGQFLVEFVNGENEVLAKRELTINEPAQ